MSLPQLQHESASVPLACAACLLVCYYLRLWRDWGEASQTLLQGREYLIDSVET